LSPTDSASARRAVLTIAMLGGFIGYLDTTIVNLAFPAISASFPGVSRATLLWVLDAYFIVGAAFLVPAGYLADRMGHKRIFVVGMAGFALASAFCAAAPTPPVLIAARVLQALAASTIGPASLALLLAHHRTTAERTRAVALWSVGAGAAAAIGPTLGGAFVSVGSWRWIFLINVPMGLLTLWMARRVPESRKPAAPMPDLLGGVLASLGIGAVAFSIVEGARWGWGASSVLAAVVGGVVALAAVVARSARHPAPIVDFEILRDRKVTVANLASVAFGISFYGLMLGNVLFLTGVWDYSVLSTGLAMTPGAITGIVVAIVSARLSESYGHWAVACAGLLLMAAGTVWYLTQAQSEPSYLTGFLPANLMTGTGIGMAGPMLGSAAVTTLPGNRFGIGSAINGTARQLGGALGISIVAALLSDENSHDRLPYAEVWAFGGLTALVTALAVLAAIVVWGPQPLEEESGRYRPERSVA